MRARESASPPDESAGQPQVVPKQAVGMVAGAAPQTSEAAREASAAKAHSK
jgi:hypothetical protein